MKTCNHCKKEKTFAEFGRLKSTKDGLRNECRKCRKRHWKLPEERIEEWKIWRINHMRQLGKNSKGRKVSEETRKRYSQARLKTYAEKKHDHNIGAFNRLYNRYKKKGLVFDKLEFKRITSSKCFYCGENPKQASISWMRKGIYYYNGIDRVNNLKGYQLENVVPCCERCNRAKLSMDIEEFRDWIKKVYNHFAGK